MISAFFIRRPIFATVLALAIVIAGGVSVLGLPIAQYPEITPPMVEVKAVYPGANATVLAETVAAPIEQEVNGVENSIYMSSVCGNDGAYTLQVTFEVGTDLDMAQVLVQNRVSIAMATLPQEVTRQGVTTKKKSSDILLFIPLTSPDGRYDEIFLANYATLRLTDEIARIPGVGDVAAFGGSDYSMRVWLDPRQLKVRGITTQDVVDAISEQNVQVAAGQIGQPPAPPGVAFQYTINTLGRLADAEQFADIIIKTEGTQVTRVGDVARVELGGKVYDQFCTLNGLKSSALAVYRLPGANALDVATQVREAMTRLSQDFPEGMEYSIPFDTTIFVRQSIAEVLTTLWQAALLVFLVIFVFLQDWRATIVPTVTIPVSLIGTFIVMSALGFSINMTTLFGLVLVIGIVVDDAIVVVENTARHIDAGLSSRQAALKAMEEVTGPVIATTLVLLAVFIPTSFLPGITGELYKQFGLTISAATVISSINALTMSPALCALLLRPTPKQADKNVFFRGFDAAFGKLERVYGAIVTRLVRMAALTMLMFGGVAVAAGVGFASLPTGFLPDEDQGYVIAGFQLPDAASQERMREVIQKADAILGDTDGVANWLAIGGFSLLDNAVASNAGTLWIILEDFEDRPGISSFDIIEQVRREFGKLQEGASFAFNPPTIAGLGAVGGFQMELQDRGGLGVEALAATAAEFATDGNTQSGLTGVNTTFRANVPQIFIDVDRTQAKTTDVPLSSLFGTLQAYLGSTYVNDFNRFGRTYQVRVQADSQFRISPDDIETLEVRTTHGAMAPVGAFVNVETAFGPQVVRRYNLYSSAAINGQPKPGFSSGEAMSVMETMARDKLPSALGYEWTGLSFQEKRVGSEAILVFAMAILFVFLVLAAQYESWTAPTSIVLSIPAAILGVVGALMARGLSNDTYTQIGVVLLIGLASKTSILIVEFARERRAQGEDIPTSAIEAAKLRFRPLLMTTISFVFGTFPLLVATGAGSASRQAVGTAVFGGMIAATVLTVLFVPVFYLVFQNLGEKLFGEDARGPDAGD